MPSVHDAGRRSPAVAAASRTFSSAPQVTVTPLLTNSTLNDVVADESSSPPSWSEVSFSTGRGSSEAGRRSKEKLSSWCLRMS
jgi:hypothetical protein